MNPRYTFETFVVGADNECIRDQARAFATTDWAQGTRCDHALYLGGPEGCGKTHLLHAIGHEFQWRSGGAAVGCVSLEKLGNEYLQAVQLGAMERFHARYRGLALVLLDSVEFGLERRETRDALVALLTDLRLQDTQLAMTGRDALRTFAGAAVLKGLLPAEILELQLVSPGCSTRRAILAAKPVVWGRCFPEEVQEFLAQQVGWPVRLLEGVILRLAHDAINEGRPVDIAAAKALAQRHAVCAGDRKVQP